MADQDTVKAVRAAQREQDKKRKQATQKQVLRAKAVKTSKKAKSKAKRGLSVPAARSAARAKRLAIRAKQKGSGSMEVTTASRKKYDPSGIGKPGSKPGTKTETKLLTADTTKIVKKGERKKVRQEGRAGVLKAKAKKAKPGSVRRIRLMSRTAKKEQQAEATEKKRWIKAKKKGGKELERKSRKYKRGGSYK